MMGSQQVWIFSYALAGSLLLSQSESSAWCEKHAMHGWDNFCLALKISSRLASAFAAVMHIS